MVKLGILDKVHKELWRRKIRKATLLLSRLELCGT